MGVLERFCINAGKENFRETSVYALACAYSYLEKEISEYLRPFKLTPAKFNALMVIKHAGKDEGISQIDIGRRLIVTASNMTRLLDNLNKEGYIERLTLKGDRRVNLIKLSKKAELMLVEVWPGYHKKITDIANLLEEKEQKYISVIVSKWCERMEENRDV